MQLTRLHKALIIFSIGQLVDWGMSWYAFNRMEGFAEENTALNVNIGFPLVILTLVVFDLLPKTVPYTNLLYTISLTKWGVNICNVLTLAGFSLGLTILQVPLITYAASYTILMYMSYRKGQLSDIV